ncbi:MAG: phenylphosphate carboxylase subunit delta [Burkholderiales bacterium]|nr:phenylphosphate carboxylase subunit delta [Burkholderiales bacterium]MCJ7837984.1 phenylphosphate carboxylase subunit delta [Burkholderiales bacterium]
MDDALERENTDVALQCGVPDGALERASALKLMIFDVDGVMTDGMLYYSERGEELKAFNIQDGHGMKMLRQYGVEVALITARSSRAVELRAANLGIAHLYQGVEDKRGSYAALLAQLGLATAQSGYMGDDLLDLPLITRCGFAATVPAAPQALKQRAHYVTRAHGGHGAVREVCELILRAQGALERAISAHLQ